MYQFSLEAYEKLFTMSIDRSAEHASKGGMVGNLDDRIVGLNAYHTLAVYKYTCRGLFEKHKLLLSIHIAARVLASMGDFNTQEYRL